MIINFIRGFCMALADSVPGVSGGTIAFILGFYDKFLDSLNSLVSKESMEKKKESLIFLAKLGVGWVIGFVLAILFLSSLFEEHIYEVSSLFIGFIILAIPLIVKEEKEVLKGKYGNIIFMIIGIAIVALVTYFNPVSGGSSSGVALDSLSIGSSIYIFIVGMVAISAMVLPGISGSTLLLIFGLYTSIVTAVKEVLTFNFASLPALIIFALGVLTGIVSTIKGIRYLLNNHRSAMIYAILGLMIGSLYAVVMGPTTLKVPHAAMDLNTFSIVFFIIGAAIIFGLEKVKGKLENK